MHGMLDTAWGPPIGGRILRLLDRAANGVADDSLERIGDPVAVELSAAALASPGDRLPFLDASFAAAVSIHSLEATSDRAWALSELRRILPAGGRLLVAVWGPLEENPALAVLGDSLRRRGGVRAEAAVRWLASLSHADDMRALLRVAGFVHVGVTRQRRTAAMSAITDPFGWLLDRYPVGAAIRGLPPAAREEVMSDLRSALEGSALEGSARRVPYTRDVHVAAAA